jgi:hypothetical protein
MIDERITLSPFDLADELKIRRLTGSIRGEETGWSCADEYISLKKGYPFMMAGIGGAGKTEFIFDLMINSSILHDWVWLVMSSETGSAEEIIEVLIQKLAKGKSLSKRQSNQLSDGEYDRIMTWLQKHFRVLDRTRGWDDVLTGLPLTLENLFKVVDQVEQNLNGKFDGILVDPFNELDINLGSNIAGQVKSELDALLRWTKQKNYFTILTNHANAPKELRDKAASGMYYNWTPPARKEDWAYGQQFGRKGYQMVLMYERHKGQQESMATEGEIHFKHSVENKNNLREFYVQKTKPKGVGKTGRFMLFYDRILQRYYEVDPNTGMKIEPIYPDYE